MNFEVKISYEKVCEDGIREKVSETYLVDALSFTEAEGRIIEEMKPYISGEFGIVVIKRANFAELFLNDKSGDRFYKVKINMITLNEKSGAERRQAVYMLVNANDIQSAKDSLIEGMKGSMADYEIESVSETKILDFFPYKA